MSIEQIKNKLADTIDKKELRNSLEENIKEAKTSVLKAVKESMAFFNKGAVKNSTLKTKTEQFFRINGKIKDESIFHAISEQEDDLLDNLATLEKMLSKEFGDKIIKESLDYRQVNVLKLIDLVEFFNRYTVAFLSYAYVLETASAMKHDKYVQESLTKTQEHFINDNWLSFCNVCSVLLSKSEEFTKKLEKISKVEVKDGNEDVLKQTVGFAEVEPFVSGFISTRWNPIIWIRRMIADRQVARYKAIGDQLRLLEIRRLHLEKLRRGEEDPVLERSINEVQDQIAINEYKLNKLNKAYGLDEE